MIIYLLNILLIEDDKDTLRIIQKYFESKGAHVTAYSDPLLALQDFIKNSNNGKKYDLVISDIRMPEMNGIELATKIRKTNKEIPILFMVGSSGIVDVDQSTLKFLNIKDVIAKPVKLKDLIERVNTTIKHKVVVKH